MASPFFRFKQFTVWHDRCAMKVGTDGVLLGAWCPLNENVETEKTGSSKRILDIGTGSGLIALMLAQRLYSIDNIPLIINIDAIDIEESAVEQARYNFTQSPWSHILQVHHSTLQDWQAEKYDIIVSNPPYFQNSLKNPNTQRATARHTDSLSYKELISCSVNLLKENGRLALVLPIEAEDEILALAQQNNLYPEQLTYVHPKPGKPAKRILIALKQEAESSEQRVENGKRGTDILYIESENSPRSVEYQTLTKDFYL